MICTLRRNTMGALLALALGAGAVPHALAMAVSDIPAQVDAGARLIQIGGLFERWNEHLAAGDLQGLVALYAPDAVLLPTASNQIRVGREAIESYFQDFLAGSPASVTNHRELRFPSENVALDTGTYTFTLADADGSRREVMARYTFLYQKVGDDWTTINHHSSAMPEPQGRGA